jgi:regulatory protein
MVSREHGESSSSPSADITVLSARWGTAESAAKVELSDGSSFFVLISRFDSARFCEGAAVGDAELELLNEYDEEFRVYRKAMDLQARREHSAFELKRKLYQRGFSRLLVDRVCSGMESEGCLDDRRFAELFVYTRLRRKPEGRIRMERRLREKGVSREISFAVLEELYTPETSGEALSACYQALLRRREGMEDGWYRGELIKRGFTSGEISAFLENRDF